MTETAKKVPTGTPWIIVGVIVGLWALYAVLRLVLDIAVQADPAFIAGGAFGTLIAVAVTVWLLVTGFNKRHRYLRG